MMNDNHGCSTCKVLGSENYEFYTSGFGRKKTRMVQYDYRHTDGELFSCCATSLEAARERRDKWLSVH